MLGGMGTYPRMSGGDRFINKARTWPYLAKDVFIRGEQWEGEKKGNGRLKEC